MDGRDQLTTHQIAARDLRAGTIIHTEHGPAILEQHAHEYDMRDTWTPVRVWLTLRPTNGYDRTRIIDVPPDLLMTIHNNQNA